MALPKLETPTYELKLPSTEQTVVFRPFLVKEHKVLLTVQEADAKEVSRIIRELVDVCTFKKLPVSDLPHFDIEYIFMMLRSKSVGENVDVVITCGNCENKYDASFNIENISIEKTEGHTNKIMLNNDVGIEMKYPDIDTVIKILDTKNNAEVVNMVAKTVKGVFSKDNYWEATDQTEEELIDFINTLTKDQFDRVENFFATSPKVVQKIESECTSCGTKNISRLEGLQNFFV